MRITATTLAEVERDAAAQNIKVSALLAGREYPVEVVALGAALDEAISQEYTARMYEIESLRESARALREGVEKLAALRDAQVLA